MVESLAPVLGKYPFLEVLKATFYKPEGIEVMWGLGRKYRTWLIADKGLAENFFLDY